MKSTQITFENLDTEQSQTDDPPNETRESNTTTTNTTKEDPDNTDLYEIPQPYPANEICDHFDIDDPLDVDTADSDNLFTINLDTEDGEVSVTFARIAGKGGMGAVSTDNTKDAADLLEQCIGAPILKTGGGMITGKQAYTFGSLDDITYVEPSEGDTNDSLSITVSPHHNTENSIRRDTRTYRIGSHIVSVPVTMRDAVNLSKAIHAVRDNKIEFINPNANRQAEEIYEHLKTLTSLSPGDTIETPAYKTDLTIQSYVWETVASISTFRGRKSIDVLAYSVSNPRGRDYLLGMAIPRGYSLVKEENPDEKHSTYSFERDKNGRQLTSYPKAHLSSPQGSNPPPNTPFSASESMSIKNIIPTENSETPDPIGPNEDLLNHPLPPRQKRMSLSDIEGVGEKTEKRLFTELPTGEPKDAHALAYAIHCPNPDEEILSYTPADVNSVLKNTPNKSDIYEELERLYQDCTPNQ